MADKTSTKDYPDHDEKTHEVPEQPLDNGYSAPGDSRVEEKPHLNEPGADFSGLADMGLKEREMPLDNTPAGKAMNNSDGRDMTQEIGNEEIPLKDDPSQKNK